MSQYKKVEEGMREVYEKNAKSFDSQRDKSLLEKKYLNKLLEVLPKEADVLDVGCGSGEPIARYLIENNLTVTGIDFSKNMIEIIQERFPDNLWIHGDMRTFSLDQKFAAIIAWDSFFHLNHQDQEQALANFAKHLLGGGYLLLTVGHEKGEVLGAVNNEPVYHASFSPEEYAAILKRLGVSVLELNLQDESCGHRSVLLAKRD